MKRKDFFKSLLGIAIAPLVIGQTAEESEKHSYSISKDGPYMVKFKDGEVLSINRIPHIDDYEVLAWYDKDSELINWKYLSPEDYIKMINH